jgi:hypothetical protein
MSKSLFPTPPTSYDVDLHRLAEHNASLEEHIRELQEVAQEATQVSQWRLVISLCRLVDQPVLTKWCNAALVWDGMPPEFGGARRYGNGVYCNNIVLEREMTRIEAVQVRKAAMAHFNAELGGDVLCWKLCEMDKASFDGGWTFLP